jgi:aspartate aminotransferase-like enzyme
MGTPIISVSQKSWEKIETRRSPIRSYHSLLRWRRYFVDAEGKSIEGDPAPSMAVNNVCALHEAVESIIQDGIDETFLLHSRAARATRLGVRAMGLQVYPNCAMSCIDCKHKGRYCSDALTVVKYPTGIDEESFRRKLSDEYGIIVSGGVGELRGKVFRIGHMGKPQVLPQTVLAAISSIENTMVELGAKIKTEEGARKSAQVLRESAA